MILTQHLRGRGGSGRADLSQSLFSCLLSPVSDARTVRGMCARARGGFIPEPLRSRSGAAREPLHQDTARKNGGWGRIESAGWLIRWCFVQFGKTPYSRRLTL